MKQIPLYKIPVVLLFLLSWFGIEAAWGANPIVIHKPVETIGVCSTDLPYIWHSKQLAEEGTYLDTIKHLDKSYRHVDTLMIYTLEFFTMPIHTVYAQIEQGSTLTYRGKVYDHGGTFFDTIPGAECDSLERLKISYAEYFHMFDTAHVCEGGTYKWRNRTLSIAGNYFDSIKTAGGKDSIYQMTLVIHYPADVYDTVRVCPDVEAKYYYWNGKRYNKAGDYTMTVMSPYGCDSTMHLHLEFLTEPKRVVNTEYFCSNIGVVINGTAYYELHTEIDTFPSMSGCDSIVETHYVPMRTEFYEQKMQHYAGQSVEWRGKIYSEDGVYFDSLTNVLGCDSVYQLRLVPKTDTYRTVNLCYGDAVEHNEGLIIAKDTLIHDTLQNCMGGDSIIHTHYNVTQRYYFTQHINICSNQQVEWVGHDMIIGGQGKVGEESIFDRKRTVAGCDSIYRLDVTYLPAHIKDTVVIWCRDSLEEKGPYLWTDSKGVQHEWNLLYGPDGGIVDTVIRDTMLNTVTVPIKYYDGDETWNDNNTGGCDSIFNLRIIVTDRCSELERIPLCYGSSVEVDSKIYNKPGRYSNTLPSSMNLNLRDSTHSFEIYYVYATEETIDSTVCELDLPLYYNGRKITQAGTYDFHLETQYGCDSLIHLRVAVTPLKYSPINEEMFCPSERFEYRLGNGRIVTKPGDYFDTIPWMGCDSVIRTRIVWAPTHLYKDTAVFKPGTAYMWHRDGQERLLTEEGVYWDSCTNVYGCDSVYYLYLREAQPFYMHEPEAKVCENELPWTWHGQLINRPGTYFDSCTTSFGLDSVYEIQVTILPQYIVTKQITLCPDEEFRINGELITGSEYRHALRSQEGCDSITIYYINRRNLTKREETAQFAEGTIYDWTGHNKQFSHGGDYYDTIRTSVLPVCDSIIYHLHLSEEHAYQFVTDSAVCLGSDEQVLWHNKLYNASGTYYDSLTTVFGMDSIWQLNLIINRDTVVQWHEELCTGGAYDFFGHMISTPGTYRSQPFPRFETGCDSIIELILQPVSTEETVIHYTICEGDEVRVGDSIITTTGVYRDTLVSSLGCDSVLRYVVTVGKKHFFTSEQLINPGSSYTWHKNGQPIVLTQAGTYWDSCRTTMGCDSIYKLTLRFNQTEYIFPTDTDFICSADLPYVWHHRSLTQTGLYYDSLQTNEGRDSVFSLYLTVYQTMHTQQEFHYCQGERPVINGMPYEKDAVFTDTLTSQTGCDSIVDYILHFHPNYSYTNTVYLHEGETYQLGDTVIRTAGVYFKHFLTQYGCDSTVTVNVKYCALPQQVTVYHDLCQGEQITISDEVITTSGRYYETRTTVGGCDSIICHIVNVHTAYLFSATATMCKGGTYQWLGHYNDTIIDRQGVYYDSLTTVHGCDSIYRLILNYKRTDLFDTIISICASDLPYKYKGKLYFTDSVFLDTLGVNREGCDSILRWNYRVNRHCSDYVQYTRCPGQTINIDGILVSAAGAYEQNHLTIDGMDSLYRFTVFDVQNYEFTTRQTGCDSVVYDGRTFYARGKGQETFTVDLHHRTVDGCDSLEHLELTIFMSSPARVYSKTIADYDSVRFGPYFYNTTGSYALHYTNANGCDSTEILNLTVLKTDHPEMEHYFICQGDQKGLDIFGKHYNPTAEYTYISDTAWVAGQPVIRTADIVMQHPFTITSFDPRSDQIVCSDHEVLFYVSYGLRDIVNMPDYYEVDFQVGDLEAHPLHQEGKVEGKTTLPILMNGQGKYVAPGYYSYRLKLRSESCTVSDTILEGSIVVRYPSTVMESAWDDAVLLVNENYNGGGWVFKAPYQWQVLSAQGVDKTAKVASDVSQPYLSSAELEEGDRIQATLIREGYERPVPSCEYIFIPTLPVQPHATLVYPSAVKAHMPVNISSKESGSFRLIDYTGRVYSTGRFEEGETQVTMPGVEGCYILLLKDDSGNAFTQKLIVY